MNNRKNNRFYVVLDDDETYSGDGYIVLDASLTRAQRGNLESGEDIFKSHSAPPCISIVDMIETLDKAGLWDRMVEELTQGIEPDYDSAPTSCPFCGSGEIVSLETWSAKSDNEPDNQNKLTEYQCHGTCQARSFWA